MSSGPGWSSKWYELQNMSSQPMSPASMWSACLSAPLVATATNPGVLITPCGVWILPTRAREPGFFEACTSS